MQRKHSVVLFILLGLCAVLAIAWAAEAEGRGRRAAEALEDVRRGTLLTAMTQLERVCGGIDKALVTADAAQGAALLSRVSSDAAAAQAALSALPLAHSAMGGAAKLCAQVSDYAESLMGRAGALSEEEAGRLRDLAGVCGELLTTLRRAGGQMRVAGLEFGVESAYLADPDAVSRPLESAGQEIEYPTLIYDGPFSDAAGPVTPRGLGEKTVTREEAVRLAAAFVGAPADSAAFAQESGGDIPAYDVRVDLPDVSLRLAVTRQGGDVLWMFPETAEFEAKYGLEDCKAAARRFFDAHGYGDMELTFWQMYAGMATLSYAAVQDGVLLYPDLVKLQLRLDTLDAVGLEARRYLSSHARRESLTPAVSREEARAAVHPDLQITGSRLCLIPLNGQEALCWQFTGTRAGQTYYVYIDAATGRQRDIQRLVVNPSGPQAE